MNLKAKFIIPTLALVLLGLGMNAAVTYQKSTAALTESARAKAQSNLTSLISLVDLWVKGTQSEVITLGSVDLLARALGDGEEARKALPEATALLKGVIGRQPGLDNLFIVDAKGKVVTAANPTLVGVDISKREYFRQAMQGQQVISSPIFSADKGEAVFVIASPIKIGDAIAGAVACGVSIGYFSKQFVTPLDSPAGYAFIIAPDGVVLAHPDKSLVAKLNVIKETDYGQQLASRDSGSLDVVSLGVGKLMFFEKSKVVGWIACMTVNKEAAFADARALGLTIITLSLALVAVLIGGVWAILSLGVLKPIHGLMTAATAVADGQLDTALDVTRRDEIGNLQRAIAKMVASLKEKIQEVERAQAEAHQKAVLAETKAGEAERALAAVQAAKQEGMHDAAAQIDKIVQEITASNSQVLTRVRATSDGAEQQRQLSLETATAMEEMTATVIEVAQNASHAADNADRAKRCATDGQEAVRAVITAIDGVEKRIRTMSESLNALGQQAHGIGAVMDVINDIADQTNLLALNAAIEAARAGDAGRGFAVVADEVRKLAEKTMLATKEVGQVVQAIQSGTQGNIDYMARIRSDVENNAGLASKAGASLQEIVEVVMATTDQVRNIATASEQQSATSEEINRSIEGVSSISDETAHGMSEARTVLDEMSGHVEDLKRIVGSMKG